MEANNLNLDAALKSIVSYAPAVREVGDSDVDIAVAKMRGVGYAVDCEEETKKYRKALKSYLEGYSLFLAGRCGAGKTYFFQCLKAAGYAQNLVIYSLKSHSTDAAHEIAAQMDGLADYDVLIDDVGTEGERYKGDDVLELIISKREASRRRTHYTGNLTREELRERYGDRIDSRLSVCVRVAFVGKDRRTATVCADDAELLRRASRPEYWELCEERCPDYLGSMKCKRGKKIPPSAYDTIPEKMCGISENAGTRAEDGFTRKRREIYAKLGYKFEG